MHGETPRQSVVCRLTPLFSYPMKNPRRTPGYALLFCLCLPVAALAQSVTVNVNAATTVRTVDERVFGLNAVIWDGLAGSSQTVAMLKDAGVRTIRLPGGSLSDEYHWRTNTNLANTWNWSSSFANFANLITGLNAQAFVTVNYGTGSPEEAAAWVAYANSSSSASGAIGPDAKGYDWQTAGAWASLRGASPLAADDGMNFLRVSHAAAYGLKFWEIGNECYGSWETDQQASQHDPYTYATRARDYIAKMKAVDPTIKVGVVVTASESDYDNGYTRSVTNPRTGASVKGWTPVMLARLKELGVTPDLVIYHRYEQAPAHDQPNNPENDATLLQKAKTWPDDTATIRRLVTDFLGSTAGASVEIVVTENNSVYSNTGKQTTSLVNGLYLADSVANVMQTEINALMWWDTRNGTDFNDNNSASLYGWRNYGDYGVLSSAATGGPATSYEPYPTYFAIKLLAKFARQGDTVVTATSNSTLLSVFAVKSTGGDLRLLVINKDPSATRDASITLTGFTPGSSATQPQQKAPPGNPDGALHSYQTRA